MKNPEAPDTDTRHPDKPLSSLPHPLKLTFHPGGDEKASQAMEGWMRSLANEAKQRLVCARSEAQETEFLPSVSLRARNGSPVYYHFVPEGPEIEVFREFLWNAAAQEEPAGADPPEPGQQTLRREMLLFVSTHCTNCPQAVRSVHSLARKLPNLSVHLFEARVHTDLAEKHNIQSVPTLLVEEELRYVGTLDEKELFSLLQAGDTLLLYEKIRQKIQGGNASEAALWIAGGGKADFLARDLGKSTFQERIALLLAFEEALEMNPRCLDSLVEPLLPYLDAEHASVRGDIADLLGKIGLRKALPALNKLCQDPDPEVAEAAAEAIESIEQQDP